MAAQLRLWAGLILIALVAPPAARAITVTYGIDTYSVTASTTSGSTTVSLTASPYEQFEPDQIISIAGVSGYKRIIAATSSTLTIDTPASATVSGAAIKIIADALDHTSVRIWVGTDVNTCVSIWFDITSHASAASYAYRSGETGKFYCPGMVSAVTITGLTPATTYYFRANAKLVTGSDNSGACNSDACGATEFSLTTYADNHGADGRPPLPTPPEEVAAHLLAPVDTTGYEVISVPGFADGATTGSISSGSTSLTVNAVPAGMVAGQWIVIAGVTCPGHGWYDGPFVGFQRPPWCHITGISGTTLTLEYAADVTVSGASVSWGLYTIWDQILNNNKRYGTVFEWAQGYKAKWYRTAVSDGDTGFKIPALPADTNGSCSTSPCALSDTHHRWMVFRTKATPAQIPPPGVRTGPEWAAALGGIVPQNKGASITFVHEWANPPHHLRFENLELTCPASGSTDADPEPCSPPVYFASHQGALVPQYVLFDRIYLHTPDANTRMTTGMVSWAGSQLALINSYLQGDYWRPVLYTVAETKMSGANGTLTFPGGQYQRNQSAPTWTVPASTITANGATATGQVLIEASIGSDNQLRLEYTSGKGAAPVCANCVLAPVATPTVPANRKRVFTASIENGASALTLWGSYYGDSQYNTEGMVGVYAERGDHWLFENNYFECYGTAQWFIDFPPAIISQTPRDIILRRNRFYWNQNRRLSSATTNGYWYQVRHQAFETKRSRRLMLYGNEMTGGWARINHGGEILLSPIGGDYSAPIVTGISDITITGNKMDTLSEPITAYGHEFGTRIMGRDVRRVLINHNLVYGQNAFVQNERAAPGFYGKQGSFGGHDWTVEHNTYFDAKSNIPILMLTGEDRSEGMRFTDNMWHLAASYFHGVVVQKLDNGSMLMSPGTLETPANTISAALNSVWVRIAASLTPNYAFLRNVITCGKYQLDPGDTPAEISSGSCSTYAGEFGALQSLNYFPSGANQAARDAVVSWAGTSGLNLGLKSASPYKSGAGISTDGLDAGADMRVLRQALGLITVSAQDPRPTGIRSCASGGGTGCVRIGAAGPMAFTGACQVGYGPSGSAMTAWTVTAATTGASGIRTFNLSGLDPGGYDYRVWCDRLPPAAGSFTIL